MTVTCAVLLPHLVSFHPDIPILELTPHHSAKNNSPHFMRLREPILQPLSFHIHAGMGGVLPPLLEAGSKFQHICVGLEPLTLVLSSLLATLGALSASVANKGLTET
jgi:hypothetical protein